jgi:hypothetical protein
MQSFLPYSDFRETMRCLDYRRLGKQRTEAKQILNAIERRRTGVGGGWINHPAVLMWEDFEDALRYYMNCAINEWVRRGYRNTMLLADVPDSFPYPDWLGDEQIHASHRANLLRKDADYYGQFGWPETPREGYIWPVRK